MPGAEALDALTQPDFHLAIADERPPSLAGAVRLPLSAVPTLGVALSSLPQATRTVATQVNAPRLLVATDKFGNLLDPSVLNRTEGGMIGSYGGGSTPFDQARFHRAGPDSIKAVSQVPYDPTALFVAAALAQINQKLDSIQRSVDELYAYARQRDKSNARANAQVLSAILADYGVNQGNATYSVNAHMKVLDIRQESRAAMDLNRERARASLDKAAPLEIRASVEKRLGQALDYLGEYRLALFAFSFATFLEPVLAQNLTAEKLGSCSRQVEEESLRYREFYTHCYDAIEAAGTSSIDAALLGGAASVASRLGRAIEETPVGDHTLIDEGLNRIGKGLSDANAGAVDRLMARLRAAKSPEVGVFQDALGSLGRLANQPSQLAVDADYAYVLPADESA